MKHVMLDLETLGTTPGSIIVSIGAVKFDASGLGDTFYQRIDFAEAQKEGFKLNADTVRWWLGQSDESRQELAKTEGCVNTAALQLFNCFVGESDPLLWGNGASFDNSILGAAYDHLGIKAPWKRDWGNRCYRTAKSFHPDFPLAKRTGTHHNALDDAISQAEHLITLPSFQAAYGV
jgi:hypothetical protein